MCEKLYIKQQNQFNDCRLYDFIIPVAIVTPSQIMIRIIALMKY